MNNSFMTPCPVNLDDKTIRIFGGIRDEGGISRIGFIDVCSSNPSTIKYVHQEPALEIGDIGCFDDNGVILGSVIFDGENWRMYYVGFQKVEKIKFYAFTGVAISNNLKTFKRKYQTPILDRKDWMKFIGAIHTVIKEDDIYKVFYAAGNEWKEIDKKTYPSYSTYYTESLDGYNFDFKKNKQIVSNDDFFYRIGRPTVHCDNGKYNMFCTYDTINKNYGVKTFSSSDCIEWIENKEFLNGFEKSSIGWDSEMVCYPNIIKTNIGKTYLFYNGNKMGQTGVGYCELLS